METQCKTQIFEKYTINDWISFVVDQINKLLSKFSASIDSSCIDEAMTGPVIRFTSNDLYEFYFILCREIGRTIVIKNYDDFYTIRNIAKTIQTSFSKQHTVEDEVGYERYC